MRANAVFRQRMEEYRQRLTDAKKRGEKVGWIATNFPQEITTSMDIPVFYPENHAAAVSLEGMEQSSLRHADSKGFSNDICSFARMNIGMESKIEMGEIPMPDFLIACTNMCDQASKWYSHISKYFHVPIYFLDIPYRYAGGVDDDTIVYIRDQIKQIIKKLETLTEKQFHIEALQSVMEVSHRNGELWIKIQDLLLEDPGLYRGADLFGYMSLMVCERGRSSTAEALDLLYRELKEKGKRSGKNEVLPIYFEGIGCWPAMSKLAISLQRNHLNITRMLYTKQFSRTYRTLDELIRQYILLPSNVSLEESLQMRLSEIRKGTSAGVLLHLSRSCKRWSGLMYGLKEGIENRAEIPVVTFDGDQGDRQSFSEAQYDTRLQGFCELLDGRRKEKVGE